jgi:hypothetical protein
LAEKVSRCSRRIENKTAKLHSYISVHKVRTSSTSLPMQKLMTGAQKHGFKELETIFAKHVQKNIFSLRAGKIL